MEKAFQDYYPDYSSHCYGCGRLNSAGLQIKSYWDGEETVCRFDPKPYHTAIPGFVYGGLIASLIDCHSTGTAAAVSDRRPARRLSATHADRWTVGGSGPGQGDQGAQGGGIFAASGRRPGLCPRRGGGRAGAGAFSAGW